MQGKLSTLLIKHKLFISLNLAIITAVLALPYTMAPKAAVVDSPEQSNLKSQLADQIDAFYEGVQTGRRKAIENHHRVGIQVSATGWSVYADTGTAPWQRDPQDKLIDSKLWSQRFKFGSNFPENSFFFTEDGHCQLDVVTVCLEEDWSHPEKVAHVFGFTSDANRNYTLSFARNGVPELAHDDF